MRFPEHKNIGREVGFFDAEKRKLWLRQGCKTHTMSFPEAGVNVFRVGAAPYDRASGASVGRRLRALVPHGGASPVAFPVGAGADHCAARLRRVVALPRGQVREQ